MIFIELCGKMLHHVLEISSICPVALNSIHLCGRETLWYFPKVALNFSSPLLSSPLLSSPLLSSPLLSSPYLSFLFFFFLSFFLSFPFLAFPFLSFPFIMLVDINCLSLDLSFLIPILHPKTPFFLQSTPNGPFFFQFCKNFIMFI